MASKTQYLIWSLTERPSLLAMRRNNSSSSERNLGLCGSPKPGTAIASLIKFRGITPEGLGNLGQKSRKGLGSPGLPIHQCLRSDPRPISGCLKRKIEMGQPLAFTLDFQFQWTKFHLS